MYQIKEQPPIVKYHPIHNVGVVIGKFMPFHIGHEILIKFAKSQVKTLYVLVDNVPNELLTSQQRAEIIQDKFPDVLVDYFPNKMPQEPGDCDDFWEIWNNQIKMRVGVRYQKYLHNLKKELDKHFHMDYDTFMEKTSSIEIDALIAAMDYGDTLAKNLNAKFIPIDIEREIVNISATKIRNDPHKYNAFLSDKSKASFTKKFAFIGAECTFKSSIAKELRTMLHSTNNGNIPTVYVPEFAQSHLKFNNGVFKKEDVEHIIISQNNLINVASEYSGGYLLCDSDALTTKVYSEFAFDGEYSLSQEMENIVRNQHFHTTFLFKPDENTPFKLDEHRKVFDIETYDNRIDIYEKMKYYLDKLNRNYVVVEGTYEERFNIVSIYIKKSMLEFK